MNIKLIVIGRTVESYLQTGMDEYCKRLSRYARYEVETIPDLKNAKSLTESQIKEAEGKLILDRLTATDTVMLLDERGEQLTSLKFADHINDSALKSVKNLVFVIGGAYGFSDAVYQRTTNKISLSKMTFSHQMVRLIFTEQLYRAYAIINNLPYHHQ